MSSKLQIALDDISLQDALELLEKIQKDINIAEVGTPFLMEYGMEAVKAIRKRFPGMEVLCDGKIMDAGGYEAEIAYRAGAEYVTVLAVTDDRTIQDVVNVAKRAGKKVMADMICISDLPKRIEELEQMHVDVLAVHTGVDQQAAGRTPLDDLRLMRSCVKHTQVAVAGGINSETIEQYLEYEPEIIIVGGGIVHAENSAEVTKKIKQKIHAYFCKKE